MTPKAAAIPMPAFAPVPKLEDDFGVCVELVDEVLELDEVEFELELELVAIPAGFGTM
jgi:hypothetical protein